MELLCQGSAAAIPLSFFLALSLIQFRNFYLFQQSVKLVLLYFFSSHGFGFLIYVKVTDCICIN